MNKSILKSSSFRIAEGLNLPQKEEKPLLKTTKDIEQIEQQAHQIHGEKWKMKIPWKVVRITVELPEQLHFDLKMQCMLDRITLKKHLLELIEKNVKSINKSI